MTCPALALLVSLALTAPALAAQPPRIPVPVGVRVRVSAPPRIGWTTGTVAGSDSARIILRAAGGARPDTIPLGGVQALDVSRGRSRLRPGLVGALLGGIVGGTLGHLAVESYPAGYQSSGDLLAPVAGFIGGALIGGTIGALTARERWERVPVP